MIVDATMLIVLVFPGLYYYLFRPMILHINDRKQSETELRESEEKLRNIFEFAADGIITIDERGIIQSVNKAIQRIFQYSESELVGQNVSMLAASPDREKHDAYMEAYHKTGNKKVLGRSREEVGQRKDGTRFEMGPGGI